MVQHSGGGKANQYFLRGFDADHGTDVAINVDGVPINMVSHAHGQGYTDTNFIIPEAVERVEITKGTSFTNQGDFATAGSINLISREGFEHSSVGLGLRRLSGVWQAVAARAAHREPEVRRAGEGVVRRGAGTIQRAFRATRPVQQVQALQSRDG